MGSWFGKKVVGSTLGGHGHVTNVMCTMEPASTSQSRGDAPLVFLGRTLPNFEGSVTSTLRFFKNFQFFVMVDSKRGYTKLDGNARVRCHMFDLCESNWYHDGRISPCSARRRAAGSSATS